MLSFMPDLTLLRNTDPEPTLPKFESGSNHNHADGLYTGSEDAAGAVDTLYIFGLLTTNRTPDNE